MVRFTTPSWTFSKPEGVTDINLCIVTFVQQDKVVVEKRLTSIKDEMTVELTQQEAGQLQAGDATMQVNFVTRGGRRLASNRHAIKVYENDKNEVI